MKPADRTRFKLVPAERSYLPSNRRMKLPGPPIGLYQVWHCWAGPCSLCAAVRRLCPSPSRDSANIIPLVSIVIYYYYYVPTSCMPSFAVQ